MLSAASTSMKSTTDSDYGLPLESAMRVRGALPVCVCPDLL